MKEGQKPKGIAYHASFAIAQVILAMLLFRADGMPGVYPLIGAVLLIFALGHVIAVIRRTLPRQD
ncbi:MAG: hypothetical protein ACFB21_08245 [Opitutales bacterium]